MTSSPTVPVILQIIPDLVTGGAERTTIDIARAITQAGWRALVVSEGGQMTRELQDIGAQHIELPVKSKNPVTMIRNVKRLQKLMSAENVSLVHARSRAPAWSAFWAAKNEKLPFVTTYHGIYNQNNIFKSLYNSVMARGDAVIANSAYTARLIASRHPFCAGKIKVVYRGSDMNALAPSTVCEQRRAALKQSWQLDENRPVILNLARLTNWKGHRVLIDAMACLRKGGDTKTVAVLAGDAQGRETYVAELKEQIARHNLQDQVRLVGHCSDVPAALALATISVIASIEPEAFGRAAVEAQAANVPVIVTDLGAVPETVLAPPEVSDSERTGWRVPPGDAEAMAKTIRQALNLSDTERNCLVTRARTHVSSQFSVEKMCSQTLEVYKKLLAV